MKIVKTKSAENCHLFSLEKSLYIAWACFRSENKGAGQLRSYCDFEFQQGSRS